MNLLPEINQRNDLENWKKAADFFVSNASHIIETHISIIAFLNDRVYKLKKPVKFDFLDFSSPNKRHQASLQEIKLNRRLAPDVYLDLIPVTINSHDEITLSGTGQVLEWVIKMRRLYTPLMLNHLISSGEINKLHLRQLAKKLYSFYQKSNPVTLNINEFMERMRHQIEDNRKTLLNPRMGISQELVDRVTSQLLQFLVFKKEIFEKRLLEGKFAEGHGDLRPEHICFEKGVEIIDCIEFNDALREVDVADDLSFLAMELKRSKADWAATEVMQTFQNLSGDFWPDDLYAFYQAYRASVRAKVTLLSAKDILSPTQQDLALSYLKLADEVLAQKQKPIAIIFRGSIGSGKSTLAKNLSEILGARIFQTDAVRRTLFGESKRFVPYGDAHYSNEGRLKVYKQITSLARFSLKKGVSVIIDGSFPNFRLIKEISSILRTMGIETWIIECFAPDAVIKKRLLARKENNADFSEAGIYHYEMQKKIYENADTSFPVMKLNTDLASIQKSSEIIIEKIKHSRGRDSAGQEIPKNRFKNTKNSPSRISL